MLNARIFCSLLVLACVTYAQDATEFVAGVENGEINGARFRIEIPEKWNGDLVMYAHGYQMAGMDYDFESSGAAAILPSFLGRGYAVAQSAYSRQGWAVKEGVEDTEALRRYFVRRHGKPGKTFITGHSMGGFITIVTLERYPDVYDGALPMCGPLLPASEFFEDFVFDLLVASEYLILRDAEPTFPDPTDPTAPDLDPEAVTAAFAAAPEKTSTLARNFGFRDRDAAQITLFAQILLKELTERAGGLPVDNRNTLYAGFGDDVAFNRGVRRRAGTAEAMEYLRRYATTTGRISDPVLTVHTSYDPMIPPRYLSGYEALAERAGGRDLFRLRWVEGENHCAIGAEATDVAFDALRNWLASGEAPEAGEIRGGS